MSWNAGGTGRRAARARSRKLPVIALAVALLAVAVLLAGCIQIINIDYVATGEAGPEYVITVEVETLSDPGNIRATLAVRIPEDWDIVDVTYEDGFAGTMTRSSAIEDYFGTTWEGKPDDDVHNGAKPGYKWWAGYTAPRDFTANESLIFNITIDTNGVGGNYFLDFVGGYTDPTDPNDPTQNADGLNWEIGGLVDTSTGADYGVVLDLEHDYENGIAPTVESTSPADGATNVSVATDPRVVFSEAMDETTVTNSDVYVREEGTVPALPATALYNPTTNTVIIDLDSNLDFDTTYEIVVDGSVKDVIGWPLGTTYVASFTTAAEPTAPLVVSTVPADGATDVNPNADITAAFDQPLDPTTVDGGSFTLEADSTAVPATVSYQGATNTAVLNPSGSLDPDTEYTATLSTDVESASGLPLAGAYSWSFTTAAEEPPDTTFPDVPPGHPYYDAIQGMAAMGIIEGFGDGTFGPDLLVYRQQFAKMIVGALALPVNESMNQWEQFTDLGEDNPTNLYPHEFVAAAVVNNITLGTTPTTFSPWRNISRAQVITMVIRAIQDQYPGLLDTPPSGYTNTWGTGFSADHGQNARIAEYNGLLDGLPLGGAASDPWGDMPRGEVAQVLWNMIEMLP